MGKADDRTEAERLADALDDMADHEESLTTVRELRDAARLLREQAADLAALQSDIEQALTTIATIDAEKVALRDLAEKQAAELERLRTEAAKRLPGQRTLDELRREIGHLQSELIRRVCGDPVKGIGLTIVPPDTPQPPAGGEEKAR